MRYIILVTWIWTKSWLSRFIEFLVSWQILLLNKSYLSKIDSPYLFIFPLLEKFYNPSLYPPPIPLSLYSLSTPPPPPLSSFPSGVCFRGVPTILLSPPSKQYGGVSPPLHPRIQGSSYNVNSTIHFINIQLFTHFLHFPLSNYPF